MSLLFTIAIWFLGSFAVMAVAGRWGRSAGGYLVASLLLSPLLAGIFLVIEGERLGRCAHCASTVRPGAAVCPTCGRSPYPLAPVPMWTGPPPPLSPLPSWASSTTSAPTAAQGGARRLARAHLALLAAGAVAALSAVVGTIVYFASDDDAPARPRTARPAPRKR